MAANARESSDLPTDSHKVADLEMLTLAIASSFAFRFLLVDVYINRWTIR